MPIATGAVLVANRRRKRQATLKSFFAAPCPSAPAAGVPPSYTSSSPSIPSPPPDAAHDIISPAVPAHGCDDAGAGCEPAQSVRPPLQFAFKYPTAVNCPPRPAEPPPHTLLSPFTALSLPPGDTALPVQRAQLPANCPGSSSAIPRRAATAAPPRPPLSAPAATPVARQDSPKLETVPWPKPLLHVVTVDATPTTLIGTPSPPSPPSPSPTSDDEPKPARKRRRRRLSPSPNSTPSRPRTRASLYNARSPSPPAPTAHVVTMAGETTAAPAAGPLSSRLNRARNAARRVVTNAEAVSAAPGECADAAAELCTSDATLSTRKVVDDVDGEGGDGDGDLLMGEPAVRQRPLHSFFTPTSETIKEVPSNISSRAGAPAAADINSSTAVIDVDVLDGPAQTSRKRPLHPFFAATLAAVSTTRDRAKTPRLHRPICDAWACPSATIHVNSVPPLFSPPCSPVPSIWPEPVSVTPISTTLNFSHYPSQIADTPHDPRCPLKADRSVVRVCDADCADMWTEKYKLDTRLDPINAVPTSELCEWLKGWYDKRSTLDDASASEASMLSERGEDGMFGEDRERIALVTGPVGCGKSTVVATAARQLGLSVLEINASVCRSGRRVRDIVGDALSTHRVGNRKAGSTLTAAHSLPDGKYGSPALAKTLILFEEVDELQADEKGFWSCVLELAASVDCKRPIVCTANSFTMTMRQYFMDTKSAPRSDLERLLVNTKEEALLNEIVLRHITFGESRSERQTASVMQRIANSEEIDEQSLLSECLSVMHPYDTRKAINQLQLWGRAGLGDGGGHHIRGPNAKKDNGKLTNAQVHKAMEVIQNGVDHPLGPSMFAIGSSNYCEKHADEAKLASMSFDGESALDSWAASLETMSVCDTLVESRSREGCTRNVDGRLPPDAIILDADLHRSAQMVDDIMVQALEVSRQRLSFSKTSSHVRDVAIHAAGLQNPPVALHQAMPACLPSGRRPIVCDVLPALVSMVRAEFERSSSMGHRVDVAQVNGPLRRTRARTRQCGLSALDLDTSTLSMIRKASILRKKSE